MNAVAGPGGRVGGPSVPPRALGTDAVAAVGTKLPTDKMPQDKIALAIVFGLDPAKAAKDPLFNKIYTAMKKGKSFSHNGEVLVNFEEENNISKILSAQIVLLISEKKTNINYIFILITIVLVIIFIWLVVKIKNKNSKLNKKKNKK